MVDFVLLFKFLTFRCIFILLAMKGLQFEEIQAMSFCYNASLEGLYVKKIGRMHDKVFRKRSFPRYLHNLLVPVLFCAVLISTLAELCMMRIVLKLVEILWLIN
jgi:hypothetical protein